MRENMLKRRENLKRQQHQNSSNPQSNINPNSNENEPSCKIPRLSSTTSFDHGSSGATRKASRWEKDEGDYVKRNVKESQEESSSHGTGNNSRRQGVYAGLTAAGRRGVLPPNDNRKSHKKQAFGI